jgi:hypothetical protein
MNKVIKSLLALVLFICLWQMGSVFAQAGPRLYFQPSSGNYEVGEAFDIVVKIDTGDKESMAADALISFDESKLKVNKVVEGDFFSGFDYNIENSNGKLTIYHFSEQALVTNSGQGDIATVVFEALDEGTASTSFLCESGVDTDSAIWDQQGNDLIDCAACGSGSYTIGQGAEPTVPDEPTSTPEPTSTTAPSEPTSTPEPTITTAPGEPTSTPEPTSMPDNLPETGIETPLLIAVLGGGIMLLFSWALSL